MSRGVGACLEVPSDLNCSVILRWPVVAGELHIEVFQWLLLKVVTVEVPSSDEPGSGAGGRVVNCRKTQYLTATQDHSSLAFASWPTLFTHSHVTGDLPHLPPPLQQLWELPAAPTERGCGGQRGLRAGQKLQLPLRSDHCGSPPLALPCAFVPDEEPARYHRSLHLGQHILPANLHSNPTLFISVLIFSR